MSNGYLKPIDYTNKAKANYREWLYNNTLKYEDKRETHSIAFFDAHNAKESKFWLKKTKNVELVNIERDSKWLGIWHKNTNSIRNKVIGLKMTSTEFLKQCPSSFSLIHLDYIGFMAPDKIEDLKLLNRNKSSKYVCINLQDIQGSVRGVGGACEALRREVKMKSRIRTRMYGSVRGMGLGRSPRPTLLDLANSESPPSEPDTRGR